MINKVPYNVCISFIIEKIEYRSIQLNFKLMVSLQLISGEHL